MATCIVSIAKIMPGCMLLNSLFVRHDIYACSTAGIDPNVAYKGHFGAVTGLHFHPHIAPVNFSDLLLTCGVDWSIKLWKIPFSHSTTGPQTVAPLHSFEVADDYILDVKWSPAHPSVFASVDGSGKLDIWNLNSDMESPWKSIQVTEGKALNRFQWDNSGRRGALGSSHGHVYIYDVGDVRCFKKKTL